MNVAVGRSRNSCFFAVRAYIKRWQVEKTIRCVKQSHDIENVRLLPYKRLRNMTVGRQKGATAPGDAVNPLRTVKIGNLHHSLPLT